jgi:histone H3/H4
MFAGGRSMMGGAGLGAAPTAGGGPWSTEELALLKVGVERHASDWKAVSRVVGSRTNMQCKDKYRLEVNAGRISDSRVAQSRASPPFGGASPSSAPGASAAGLPGLGLGASMGAGLGAGLGLGFGLGGSGSNSSSSSSGASLGFGLGASSSSGAGLGFGLPGLSSGGAMLGFGLGGSGSNSSVEGLGFGLGGSSSSGQLVGGGGGGGGGGTSSSAWPPAASLPPVTGGSQATADATAAVLQKLAAIVAQAPSAPAPAPGSNEAKMAQFWSERVVEAQTQCSSGVVKVTTDPDVPQQRVKRIMKSDAAEHNMLSADCVALLARASSLFAQELTVRSWLECERTGHRTLGKRQITDAVQRESLFDFLLPLVDGSLDNLESACAAGVGAAGGGRPESVPAEAAKAGEAAREVAHDGDDAGMRDGDDAADNADDDAGEDVA